MSTIGGTIHDNKQQHFNKSTAVVAAEMATSSNNADKSSKPWWKKSPTFPRKIGLSKTLSDTSMEMIHKDSRPPSQLAQSWTDLEEDGTLYSTMLKKVRYRSHTLEDLDEGDLSFKQWETVKIRQMKAGTLEKLVEHLTPPTLESEPGFLLAFLCTYKSFSTTTQVVELLLKRFEAYENQHASPECDQESAEGIIRRICSVISIWIDQYALDFDEPPLYENLSRLIKFTEKRKHVSATKELHNRCANKLTTLTVSPFDDEKPFKFKFCSCVSVIGCTCAKSNGDKMVFRLNDFTDDVIAEQLTLIDSELFRRVVPRECLAYFWSKRDLSKGAKAQSIKITVEQFNAVSLKVISTILNAKDDKSRCHSSFARSKAIMKWIDVALELREIKNFSSLKAILSGLQSSAIYRLNLSWQLVSKFSKEVYEELSEIFSSDSNQKASRDLLIQEGTAKYSTNSLRRSKRHSKRESWIKEGRTHGTVPYLGTFLTDLMMIDTAFPDNVKDLINFEKRRKEFDIVVQIRLLQQAAKNYKLEPHEDFFVWFNSIDTYSDKQGHERSLEVEPPLPKNNNNNNHHHHNNNNMPSTPQPIRRATNTIKKYLSEPDLLQTFLVKNHASDESMTDSLFSLVSRNHLKPESLSSRTTLDPKDAKPLDKLGVVARVYLQDAAQVQYKSIKILPNHKASDVITSTLQKFKSSSSIVYYSLYQVIDSKKSLHIPLNSNMYYAMHKCEELCFKVARKKLSKKSKKLADLAAAKETSNQSNEEMHSPTSPSNRSFSFQITNEIATEGIEGRLVNLKSYSPL